MSVAAGFEERALQAEAFSDEEQLGLEVQVGFSDVHQYHQPLEVELEGLLCQEMHGHGMAEECVQDQDVETLRARPRFSSERDGVSFDHGDVSEEIARE